MFDTFYAVVLAVMLFAAACILWGFWFLVTRLLDWLLGRAKTEPDTRPPTERQLNYIDALIEKRETEPWMLEKDPETIIEASALIEALLEQPYRED